MINTLIKIANNLDAKGLEGEAGLLDSIIKKISEIDDEERDVLEEVEDLLGQRNPSYNYKNINFYEGFEEKHLNSDSPYSYFDGSADELKKLIANNIYKAVPSTKKNGTLEVPLPSDKFYSGVVTLKEGDVLSGGFNPHMGHRELRKSVTVSRDEKEQAKFAKAIVSEYRDGFIVYTIIAGDIENEPMNPQTMMYNRFTQNNDTRSPEEFLEALEGAFNYWKDKAMWSSL